MRSHHLPLISRFLLALAALIPLTACWSGAPWYADAEAVTAIPDGRYRLAEPGSPLQEGDRITVRNRPDKVMHLTGAEHPWRGIAIAVDPARKDHFLLQLQELSPDGRQVRPKALYMLLDVQPAGLFVTILPCTGSIAEGVEKAGGFHRARPAICGQLQLSGQGDAGRPIEGRPARSATP